MGGGAGRKDPRRARDLAPCEYFSPVEINERQRFLLEKVVEAHVALGQPVGSKWLSEQPDVPWGPSTVRAELARWEELGLLRHPHTSAGREPTDRGYRAHVDQMLEAGNLPVPAQPV